MEIKICPQFITDLLNPNNTIKVFYYDLAITYDKDKGMYPLVGINGSMLRYHLTGTGDKDVDLTYSNLLDKDIMNGLYESPRVNRTLIIGNKNNVTENGYVVPNLPTTRISNLKFLLNLSPIENIILNGDTDTTPDTLYIFYLSDNNTPVKLAALIRATDPSKPQYKGHYMISNTSNYIELDLFDVIDEIKCNLIIGGIFDGYSSNNVILNEAYEANTLKSSELPVLEVKHNLLSKSTYRTDNIEYRGTEINPYRDEDRLIRFGTKIPTNDEEGSYGRNWSNGIPPSNDQLIDTFIDLNKNSPYPLLYRVNTSSVSEDGAILINEDEDISVTNFSRYALKDNKVTVETKYKLSNIDSSQVHLTRGLEEIYYMNRNAIRLLGKVLTTYSGDTIASATPVDTYDNKVPEGYLNAILVDKPTEPSTRNLFSANLGEITHLTARQSSTYNNDANAFTNQGQYFVVKDVTANLPNIPAANSITSSTKMSSNGLINTFKSANTSINTLTQVLTSTENQSGDRWEDTIFTRSSSNNGANFTNWSKFILHTDKDVFEYNATRAYASEAQQTYVNGSRTVRNAEKLQGLHPNTSAEAFSIVTRDVNASTNINTLNANDITITTNLNSVSNSILSGTTTINGTSLAVDVGTINLNGSTSISSNTPELNITTNNTNIIASNKITIGTSSGNVSINTSANRLDINTLINGNELKLTTSTNIRGDGNSWNVSATQNHYNIAVGSSNFIDIKNDTLINSASTLTLNSSNININSSNDVVIRPSNSIKFGFSGKEYTINGSNVDFNGASLTATSVTTTSLRSAKRDIEPTNINAIELLNNVNVVNFKYKNDDTNTQHVGFIADDTDTLLSDNHTKMDHQNCIGVLIKAVQELNKKLEDK